MDIRVLESLSTLAIRVVIALIAFALMASEMAFALSEKDHWENTKISETNLKQIVNKQNCYKNENYFLGCIHAINSLLKTSEKTLSNKNIESFPGMKETLKNVERIQIKNFSAPFADFQNPHEYWPQYVANRNMVNKSWSAVYHLTQENPLSIDIILQNAIKFTEKTYYKYKIATAINAFYAFAFDPHTHITPLSLFNEVSSTDEQTAFGLGLNIKEINNQFVLEPTEGSPAESSGIKNFDVLEKVNEKSTQGLSHREVSKLLRELPSFTLSIIRNNEKLNILVSKEEYTIKNISGKILNDPLNPKKKIGYIKLNNFSEIGVCQKFIYIAKNLHAQGAKALILDLRNNRGGFRSESTCIASTYLNEGKLIVTNRDFHTNKTLPDTDKNYYAKGGAQIFDLYKKPLLIIQNGNSASGSELLAGALSAYGRAIVIGERSYGKGTSQKTELNQKTIEQGFILRKTYARFHFANDATNQIVGITPDIEAHSTKNPAPSELFTLREVDEYPNAVVTGKSPTGMAEYAIDEVKRCMQVRNLISKESIDYQLLSAREAASCIVR